MQVSSMVSGLSVLFLLLPFVASDCVMRGTCGINNQLMCKTFKNTSKIFRRLVHKGYDFQYNAYIYVVCPNQKIDVCCDYDGIRVLAKFLDHLNFWMRKESECFRRLRNILCDIYCNKKQDRLFKVLQTGQHSTVTAIRVRFNRRYADVTFEECSKIKFLWWRIVDKICIRQPCNTEEFFRSLGATKAMGGVSPFLIEFKLEDDFYL